MNFFAYGTLMCEDIMHDVSGFKLVGEAGTLRGFCRYSVKGEHYPALARHNDTQLVKGVVYRDVPDFAWERFDQFEGEMYQRQSVTVELANGKMLAAETYVIRTTFLTRLTAFEWDFSTFLQEGKAEFKRSYGGFEAMSRE